MKVVIEAVLRLLNTLELTTAAPAAPAANVVRHAAVVHVATGGNFGPAILSKVLAHHEDVSIRKNEKGKTREIAEK